MKDTQAGLFIITFSLLALLAACSVSPENALVGKWSMSTRGEIKTMEFFREGTFQVVDKREEPDLLSTKMPLMWKTYTWDGDYKFIAKNRIKLTYRGLESPDPGGSTVDEIFISQGELFITAPDGTVSKYAKAK